MPAEVYRQTDTYKQQHQSVHKPSSPFVNTSSCDQNPYKPEIASRVIGYSL